MTADGARLTAAVTGGILPAHATVHAGPLDLHCLVWGRASDPTAVLLHGNGAHAHWWDPLVASLVPGWRLVVPDLPQTDLRTYAEAQIAFGIAQEALFGRVPELSNVVQKYLLDRDVFSSKLPFGRDEVSQARGPPGWYASFLTV